MAKRLVEPDYDVYKVDEVDLVLERDFYIVGSKKIDSSELAANVFMQFWKENLLNVQEQMSVMLLNQANKVIGMYQHSKGAINSTTMDIQLISAVAVKSLAKGVIVAHNHPSGNLTPSDADKRMTEMLKKALALFNINLIDSLIITSDSSQYYSFLDSGIMERGGMLFEMARGGKIKEPKPQMIPEAYELGRLAFLSGKKNVPFYDKALSDLIKSRGGSAKTYIDYSDSWSKGYLYEMLEDEDKLTGEREGERKAGMDEMASGGYMEKGGKISTFNPMQLIGKYFISKNTWGNITNVRILSDDNIKIEYERSSGMLIEKSFSKEELFNMINGKEINGNSIVKKMASGGYMAEGGEIVELPKVGSEIYARWSNSMQWTLGTFIGETKNGFEVYDRGIKDKEHIEYYAQISKNPHKINPDILYSKNWKNRNYKNYHFMSKGGKVTFDDKVKAIKEKLLKYKKVSPKVQKDYGKIYSPKEAQDSASRIAGAMRVKELKNKK